MPDMAKGVGDRGAWTTTTHDWSVDVDRGHLAAARALAQSLGTAMALHLVLEVVAYAEDEAAATFRLPSPHVVPAGELRTLATAFTHVDVRVTESRWTAPGPAPYA